MNVFYKWFLMWGIIAMGALGCAQGFAQGYANVDKDCAQWREASQPQSTPQESYEFELDMMKAGVYCYDLPVFDDAWRAQKASSNRAERHKLVGQMFSVQYQVHMKDDLAVIYYTEDFTLGPVFLFKADDGWVIDRTAVMEHILYGNTWMVKDDAAPYLDLLKEVYILQKGTSSGGVSVYRPASKG